MMKERSWNLQGMESIENSMDLRAKEKHEEEHERFQERKKSQNNQSLYRGSQDYQPDLNSLKEIKQRK
jgi:hypothetical protein